MAKKVGKSRKIDAGDLTLVKEKSIPMVELTFDMSPEMHDALAYHGRRLFKKDKEAQVAYALNYAFIQMVKDPKVRKGLKYIAKQERKCKHGNSNTSV